MSNRTALKAAFKKHTIEGRIQGLATQLYKLAPHPDNPAHRGAHFISLNSAFKPAANYEGALGSIMLEGFVTAAFCEAANDNALFSLNNLDNFGEAVSEYLEYKADKNKGKGTFALGEHKTICNQFEEAHEPKKAYIKDLEQRLQIEEAIASLSRELNATPVYA